MLKSQFVDYKCVQYKVYIQQKAWKINDFRVFSDRIMDNSMEERLLSPEELNSSDLKRRVWNESKKLWVIAFPGMVARVSSFGMIIVTQLFMGHISELDLAAYGLQQSILLRFVDGILVRPPLNILLL
jgi:MATE family multidrug resistance protein